MSHIACPSCQKDDMVQKITAIVGGETVSTKGYSSTSGSSDLRGTQNIYDNQGRYIGEGRLSGSSSSGSSTSINTTQRSTLAGMLQPPRQPVQPSKPVYPTEKKREIVVSNAGGELGLLIFLVSIAVCIIMWVNATHKPTFVESIIGIVLITFAVFIPFLIPMLILEWTVKNVDSVYQFFERRSTKDELIVKLDNNYKKEMEEYESKLTEYSRTLSPRYERQIGRWNKAFYCRRCDVVYIPGETRSVAPASLDLIL